MEPDTGDTILFTESVSNLFSVGKFVAKICDEDKVRYLLELPDGAIVKIDRDCCTVHRP